MDPDGAAPMRVPQYTNTPIARMSSDLEMKQKKALQAARQFFDIGDGDLTGVDPDTIKLSDLGFVEEVINFYLQWPISMNRFLEERKEDNEVTPVNAVEMIEDFIETNCHRDLRFDKNFPPLGEVTETEAEELIRAWKTLKMTAEEINKCWIFEDRMPFNHVSMRRVQPHQLRDHFFVPALTQPTWAYQKCPPQNKPSLTRYTKRDAALLGLTCTTPIEAQTPLATQNLAEHRDYNENPTPIVESNIQYMPSGLKNPYFLIDPPGFNPNLADFDYFGVLFQSGAWFFVIYPIEGEPGTAEGLGDVDVQLQTAWIERPALGQFLKAEWTSLPMVQVGRAGLGSVGTPNGEWHYHSLEMQTLRGKLVEKAHSLEKNRQPGLKAQAYRRHLFWEFTYTIRDHLKLLSWRMRYECRTADCNGELVHWDVVTKDGDASASKPEPVRPPVEPLTPRAFIRVLPPKGSVADDPMVLD